MLLLLVASERGGDSQNIVARRFPFTIGRSEAADFKIDAPGVWDTHARIEIQGGTLELRPIGEALVLLNDVPFQGGHLRAGDRFSIGAASITVTLSPARRYALGLPELLIWLVIFALSIVEILLILSF